MSCRKGFWNEHRVYISKAYRLMIYFANPTGNAKAHMIAGDLGFIATPLQGNKLIPGVTWCADNGCFNDARFTYERWWAWLEKHVPFIKNCVFATAPDVVGDHEATLERSAPWLPWIRALGYPVAFVAQDGATPETMPWGDFDVLFVGGNTDWKLGRQARELVRYAKDNSLVGWVHMGRVNSNKRWRYAEFIGCDSADGTYLTRGPDVNLPKLLRWVDDLDHRPLLFKLGDAS